MSGDAGPGAGERDVERAADAGLGAGGGAVEGAGAQADRQTGATPASEPGAPAQGPDLVRAALASARASARARGINPGAPARRPRRPGPVRSGSGADARDPEPLGAAVRRLVEERGWQDTTAAASVLARWEELVGAELAEHCRPASLLDGELVLVAESSAWATQLRLLTRTLQARISAQVGAGVVTSVVVRGPAQPDWRKGPRRVRGRGPRDTYG